MNEPARRADLVLLVPNEGTSIVHDDRGAFVASRRRAGSVAFVPERVPAEPAKLLEYWMEWERGDTPPGRVISNLKTAGLRELLEVLVEARAGSQQEEPTEVTEPPV